MQVDAVLGLSMTPTSVGLVLVEGQEADGATMDGDAFDVRLGAIHTSEQAAAAVLRTKALAAARGHRLHSIGVTWSEDSDAEASLLMRSLSESGFENVVPVRMPEATQALARGIANVIGFDTTAVCVIEPDTVIALIVNTRDGAVHTALNHAIDSDEGLIGWLSTVFARADWQPEALVVVGSAGGFDSILLPLEEALSVPVFAPEEAQLALARGAALASAHSVELPLHLDDDAVTAFAARGALAGPRHGAPSRSRLAHLAPATMLVAGVLTFVVSVSLAVSLQLSPRADIEVASPAPAAVDRPQPPAAVRAVAPALPAPAAIPPAPEAPPVDVAAPVEVVPAETPILDEASADGLPPADPNLPPAAVAPPPDAVAPAAMTPPPEVAPVPAEKPGLLTRIKDKLRIGDEPPPSPAPLAPTVPPVYPGAPGQ